MIHLKRTDSADPDFRSLVVKLDKDLAIRDGEMHGFYNQFNTVVNIRNVVVAYKDDTPAGCGAFKEYAPGIAEVKRMFVGPENRRKGIAAGILAELEKWAGELGYDRCILETGINQPEAIALYGKNGYTKIPNYDQYEGVETSVCFEKHLKNLP
jgi:GNAT superfamily N-acetyltransferase